MLPRPQPCPELACLNSGYVCSCLQVSRNNSKEVHNECCRYSNVCQNIDWGCDHVYKYKDVDKHFCKGLTVPVSGVISPPVPQTN